MFWLIEKAKQHFPVLLCLMSFSIAYGQIGVGVSNTGTLSTSFGNGEAVSAVGALGTKFGIGEGISGQGTIFSYNINITAPNNNEIFTIGSNRTITWTSGGVWFVKIDYTTNDGITWLPIIPWTINAGSYSWNVKNTPSAKCRIRVSDFSHAEVSDKSDNCFTISSGGAVSLLKFKVVSPEVQVKKTGLSFGSGTTIRNIKPLDANGTVEYTDGEISLPQTVNLFTQVNLLNDQNQLVGHIPFAYTQTDLTANTKIDALLYVHGVHGGNYPGWDYYQSGERMVSMLIPPRRQFSEIYVTRPPAMFVHGVGGGYPYWGLNTVDSLNIYYDTWQFYYPYDQEIQQSGTLLGKSINELRKSGGPLGTGNYSARVNIVAHSMGGLVTRSLIQGSGYANNIQKFLMLGTPNNGSYSAYRIRNEMFPDEVYNNKDDQAPAYKQLSPASQYLMDLNAQFPKSLFSGAVLNKTYLVTAGKKADFRLSPLLHLEMVGQDDGVVGVSSASLLNLGIPLATVQFKHTELPEELNVSFIIKFLDDSYDPTQSSEPLFAEADGFWLTRTDAKKTDNSFTKGKAPLYIAMPGVDRTSFPMEQKGQDIILYPGEHLFNTTSWGGDVLQRSRKDETSNYFAKNAFVLGNAALINMLPDYEIGLPIPETGSTNYNLVFKKRTFKYGAIPSWENNVVIPNIIPFKYLQANSVSLQLSSTDRTKINEKQSLIAGLLKTGEPDSKRFVRNKAVKAIEGKSYLETQFVVDNSIDSLVFSLSSGGDSINFPANNFHLLSPSNQTVDSSFAANNPSTYLFGQNLQYGIADYFIRHPQAGIWKARYDAALTTGNLSAPIESGFVLPLSYQDSSFVINKNIKIDVALPQPVDYSNVQHTCSLYKTVNNSDTLEYIQPIVLMNTTQKLTGSFSVSTQGIYTVRLDFTCLRNAEQINRTVESIIEIKSIANPSQTAPANLSKVPTPSALAWSRVGTAQKYRLHIYAEGDTIPRIDTIVADTAFTLNNLSNSKGHYWRVASLNETDTSMWTGLWKFTVFNKSLSILRPGPLDTLYIDSVYTVQWADTNISSVRLTYKISDADTFHTIASAAAADQTYNWLVPNTISGACRLYVYDGDDSTMSARTDTTFFILPYRPDTPLLMSPANNSANITQPVPVKWRQSSRAAGYRLQIAADSLFATMLVNDSTLTDTLYSAAGLLPEAKYYWRVIAQNAGGKSSYSEKYNFTTKAEILLRLTAFLEGLYDGTRAIADTATAYLASAAPPYSVLDSTKFMLDSLGVGFARFYNAPAGQYYVVVKHRNSIETWSKTGGEMIAKNIQIPYDFTSDSAQTYGANVIRKGGRWCIYSGDVNQDGIVDYSDLQAIDNASYNFAGGYISEDLTGDAFVDYSDLSLCDNNSFSFVSAVKPGMPKKAQPQRRAGRPSGY